MQIKVSDKFQNEDFKLCYVDGNNTAWFTTQPLTGLNKQTGDDWNNSPYEHNAGEPYFEKDHELVRLVVEGFRTPAYLGFRCSVDQINAGMVAWLSREYSYLLADDLSNEQYVYEHETIHAGTDLPTFISKVKEAGGEVLIPSRYINF
jgi:hypothetical protein